jgi:hypothetical protein
MLLLMKHLRVALAQITSLQPVEEVTVDENLAKHRA